ncbi:urea carboxylase [Thermaurantiacus sp.]
MTFDTVLVANRGAIACRIIRTLRRMGLKSVAVYSEADTQSLHVAAADEAVPIGPPPAAESYLSIEAILEAARKTGAGAIHPGYGFLAENPAFAEACLDAGITFIGPAPATIRTFGLKHSARALAAANGVPLLPGSGLLADAQEAVSAAEAIGYPVVLKATAGGGGIGLRVCESAAAVRDGFAAVARLGAGSFGNAGVFLERHVARARHIEVQIFGDGRGRVVALGERDCSLQRRNQKVVEEAPAPGLSDAQRTEICTAALRLAAAARYLSAGTVEFLYDAERGTFSFLEVNTRLQVEHGVTEELLGIDLVEWMVRAAAGDFAFLDRPPPQPSGHALEVRLYAEDPAQDFRPTTGMLTEVRTPRAIRTETWVRPGTEVSAWYDPMLAKLIAHGPTRSAAIEAMQVALDDCRLQGPETNLRWLREVVRDRRFADGEVSTRLLESVAYRPRCLRVLAGGAATTVQDWPGRVGLWPVGVPPSGPFDDRSFRIGNLLLGNAPGTPGLEVTAIGPSLRFDAPARICLTGADFDARLDGRPVPRGMAVDIAAGQTLEMGRVRGPGLRGYILFAGGLDVGPYLGSAATFTLGRFGGAHGRALVAGDVLHLGETPCGTVASGLNLPELNDSWVLRVLDGPQGAPDFFTPDDIARFLEAEWRVHYSSNRTGVRLLGPRPEWARRDGGEAGLHPSNIHDNPYAIGAVDFTGDLPVILGPDGPSLGGFVCPFTVIAADLWKVGQLAPGNRVRFVPVSRAEAAARAPLGAPDPPPRAAATVARSPILAEAPARSPRPRVTYRQQGDCNILVEYGEMVLDLELRVRVHALMQAIAAEQLPGVIDVTPGIRSLQLHFDPARLSQDEALAALERAEARIGDLDDIVVPSRIVYLPLSWRDPAVEETIRKYMSVVRADAPWCPDNIAFIRRINGLADDAAVERILFEASYLVLGLGDVYLGAPVATPVDPRHRLVTTKYNPARTWTPPNMVGIGGAYLCIYGMEGPGGYQLVGRTTPVWNSWCQTANAGEDKPWVLRFFDRIRFFPVSAGELVAWRRDFPSGRRAIRIEEGEFRLSDYRRFLRDNAASIAAFEARRKAAFDAERAAWERAGEFAGVSTAFAEDLPAAAVPSVAVPEGAELIEAPFGGSIWKLLVTPGDRVRTGEVLAILESMKMECPFESPADGTVAALYVAEGEAVAAGTPMLALRRGG